STQWTVESFRAIEEQQRRYVLVDRKFLGLPANFVGSDDIAVGSIATTHLIQNGCKRIAHVGGRYVSTAVDRLHGYRQALIRAGMAVDEQLIVTRSRSDDAADISGYQGMKGLLELPERPDGVFCHNDPMARGAMRAVIEAGLRIPEDIAIIGSGNVSYAPDLRVPLSSIDQQSELLGEQAARLALRLMASKQAPPPEEILIRPRLMARASSLRAGCLAPPKA
ncbi:MAG: substrate-binding domain-containing protein, partial [Bryobacteraceae bacterium]